MGLAGEGGATEEMLGVDLITPLLGGGGLIGNTLGGGSDGALAGNAPEGGVLPPEWSEPLVSALAQIESQAPPLGVSGEGGLGEDLFGHDITGMLIGTEDGLVPNLLSGGNDGHLGDIAPADGAPLASVGDVLAGVIAGAQANPSDGNLNALEPIVGPLVLGLLGAGGEGEGPLPVDVPLPDIPFDQFAPVTGPASEVAADLLSTPLLPNGTTGYDVVFPLVFGAAAGIAGNTLPLETIVDTANGALP
ncbi:MAG: hypothetical protein KF769_02945 [Parvibaculum sp.]|nr:hypothetical protein [Parvibaculum sp.]